MILHIITPSNPPGKSILPIPILLGSVGLEILIPQGEILPPENKIRIPLKHKQTVPEHFKLLVWRDQQTRKGVTT